MNEDIVVVGAGVAGLACAQALSVGGASPIVLEKSVGVGGRCATRRVEDQPVDHGLVFLHGADPDFLAALRAVPDATLLEDWPGRVHGAGTPCHIGAFSPGERRTAYEPGVNVFPKHLAQGLDVRRETRVVSLALVDSHWRLSTAAGVSLAARTVVLALPVEQSRALLDPLPAAGEELDAARRLLAGLGSLACLTVIAGHPPDASGPAWDIALPEDSTVIQLISHDSAKRARRQHLVLVHQAHPSWSRERLDSPPESWTEEILREAGRLLGAWAARPLWRQAHRWRYARTDLASALSGPMLLTFAGGARLGLAGEVFAPGGGVEAAWLSGRRLAGRILEEKRR